MTAAGFLIVDKPVGVTSFAMVSLVRRLSGVRRVGHAGTLDPLASGVLPVAVGAATRFIEYMDDNLKTYVAIVRLGSSTTTYDAEGEITGSGDASGVGTANIEAELAHLVGDIEQVPPLYSAIKLRGKPLYRYAREGAPVEPAARRVSIERIELLGYRAADVEIEVTCGKGTYIRSIAHDLGERLGCGGHLAALRRTASGGFTLEDAQTPDELIDAESARLLTELLLAPDRALERRPAALVGADSARALRAGRDVSFESHSLPPICRAYTDDGDFVGVLRHRPDGGWHPEKVILGADRA
jgi:tRNA pseudouridine55 synthase